MKRTLFIILIYTSLLLTISCKENSRNEGGRNIVLQQEFDGSIKLSAIADAAGYILLETSEQSLLSQVDKIQLDKSGNIFLLDKDEQRLLKFSKNGDYLGNIGTRGRGPNECIDLTDFNITAADSIEIYDSETGKLLIYDAQGIFSRYTNKESGYSQFAHVGSTRAFYTPCGGFCGDLLLSHNGKSEEFFTSRYKDYMYENSNSFFVTDTDIYYTRLFDNTIYHVTDGNPEEFIVLDFNQFTHAEDNFTTGDERLMRLPNNFSLHYHSDNLTYITFFQNQQLVHQLHHYSSGENTVGTVIENDVNYLPIGARTCVYDDKIFSSTTVRPNQNTADYLKNLPEDQQETLADIIQIYENGEIEGKQVVVWWQPKMR